METLVDVFRHNAHAQSDQVAYTFLRDASSGESVRWRELWDLAEGAAGVVREYTQPGDRALLAYPPGLDFISTLLGCLLAGVTVVPIYPPTLTRKWDRLEAIVADAMPSIGLVSSDAARVLAAAGDRPECIDRIRWLNVDLSGRPTLSSTSSSVQADIPAMIQYTSGSTGNPKGVVITHANLVANTTAIGKVFGASSRESAVFWLPPYHDMGLIGGIFASLACRVPTTLMAPASFLRRPIRWLESISRLSATISGAPNFAYALCEQRVREQDLAQLDLSAWEVAFCGAEPINPEALRRFAHRFSNHGFRANTIYPCYGLAEATLMVTGGTRGAGMTTCVVDAEALETLGVARPSRPTSRSREVVGCGQPVDDQDVRIIDPETCREVQVGTVGEIWVRGSSVADGYWRQPEETRNTFQARLADSSEAGHFLRTGDLGFFSPSHGRELFITGRIKDILIVAGRNLYPEDLEWTVSASHPLLQGGRSAAFAVDDQIVLLVETDLRAAVEDLEVVRNAVRVALFEAHGVNSCIIEFVGTHTIPLTTSGKVKRKECRSRFEAGTFKANANRQSQG